MTFVYTPAIPQRRRRCHASKAPPFPVPVESQTEVTPGESWWYYTAYIEGDQILVKHSGDIEQLYSQGFFGKGTLSRHRPSYAHRHPVVRNTDSESKQTKTLRITSRRQYLQHLAWADPDGCNAVNRDVLPLPKKRRKESTDPSGVPRNCANGGENQTTGKATDCVVQSDLTALDDLTEPSWEENAVAGTSSDFWGPPDDETEDPWATDDVKQSADFWGIDPVGSESDPKAEPKPSMEAVQPPGQVVDTESSLPQASNQDSNFCETQNSDSEKMPLAESLCSDTNQTTAILANNDSSAKMTDTREHISESLGSIPGHSETRQVDMGVSVDASCDSCVYDPRCLDPDPDPDLLVVDDTEDSDVDSEQDTRPRWKTVAKRDPCRVIEELQLLPEETFFLSYALGCLVTYDESNSAQDLCSLWRRFCGCDTRFLHKYAVYHNFRSKGWVPKSGLKYGSDYVVYKEGPARYHSTYSVIVRPTNDSSFRTDKHQEGRCNNWTSLSALNRVTEQVSKDLMICYVIEPESLTDDDKSSPKCLSQLKIQEVVVRRWASKHERENAEYILIP